jgi:large subunit ribosomal protein L10
MNKKKVILINELKDIVESKDLILVFHYNQLFAKDLIKLKEDISLFNFNLKIIKNSYIKQALKDTKYQNLDSLFSGSTLVIYSTSNEFNLTNLLKYLKSNSDQKLFLLGGIGNQELYSAQHLDIIKEIKSSKAIYNHVYSLLKKNKLPSSLISPINILISLS